MTGPGPHEPDQPGLPDAPDAPDETVVTTGSNGSNGPAARDAAGGPGNPAGPPPRGCRCCLVVLGGVLFFIAPFAVVTVFLLSMSSSPDDSVRDWMDAVRQGRYDAAVHQMCPRLRDSLSAAELRARVDRAGGIAKEEIGQTITRSSRDATVRTTVTGVDGGTHGLSVSVVRDGDLWRVCSLP